MATDDESPHDGPVTWLVQRPPPGDDSPTFALLAAACARLGLSCVPIEVVPGVPVELPPCTGPTVVHGRATLLRTALAHARYREAVFFDRTAFTYSSYVRGWRDVMLNPDARAMPWNEALRALERAPHFVRPEDDDKLFAGGVYRAGEFRALVETLRRSNRFPDDARVVICPEREIDAEARLFIVDGEVVSGSFFRPDADPTLPADLCAFARAATARWQPHDVFVLDVARSARAYRVVEANGFNNSRFYAADVDAVVDRVSQYQRRRWRTVAPQAGTALT
jgi:hypothetical protein